jgi:uncharacterized protein (DUF58 family)
MKTTPEGKRFLLATFLITVAAVNTGNNLIYLILSLMLSFILLSIVLLKINLSGLSLEVSINPPVFAGENTFATFYITNNKRFIPTYSVNVLTAGTVSPAYCVLIPSLSTVKKEIKIKFERRGLHSCEDFHIQSGFPFILFSKQMSLKVSADVLVYPALLDVENIISEVSGHTEEEQMSMIGQGDEIYSIRDFRYGDDLRKIHWKASAKASSLQVKEYSELEFKKVSIIIDNIKPSDNEMFEKVVSMTGSICRYFLKRGYLVRVLSCKKVIPFGAGDEHLFRILDVLAVIKEDDKWDCPILYDREGFFMMILKSQNSVLNRYGTSCDMVIYADTL